MMYQKTHQKITVHQNETWSIGSVGKLRTGFPTLPLLGTSDLGFRPNKIISFWSFDFQKVIFFLAGSQIAYLYQGGNKLFVLGDKF